MNPRIILNDFSASVKAWRRSPGTVFWTLAFPVILILIFGAIFSGTDDISYDIHIQDLDDSTWSKQLIEILDNISALTTISVDQEEDIDEYIKENEVLVTLVIPNTFSETINQSFFDESVFVNITMHYDPSESSAGVIQGIIASALQEFNMQISGGYHIIGITTEKTVGEDFSFIDFFVPGMIGFTIMQTCIYGSIERNTKFRKNGILRKLLTTPITRTEWILSKMLFMLFLSFISTTVIVLVGVFVWSLTIHITPLMIILVVANSFLFSGIGMIIGRFVKEEETADMAGGAISFPMMFLAGTFFPLEQMPMFLQTFARVLPLYYVNEGLRNAMIYMNFEKAVYHTAFVVVFAAIFFIAGILLTKWSEE